MKYCLGILLKACALTSLSALIALGVNGIRADGLPLVADKPYEIYNDCPMFTKEALAVEVAQIEGDLSSLTIIDARQKAEFGKGHIPGAQLVSYHPLNSPPAELMSNLQALGPNSILVYGDTVIDSGRLLAAEFSGAGCRGVRYLKGGFPAWVAAKKELEPGSTSP